MLGFMQEHGPWVMENGGDSFHENDYSWNKEANMLYIESPAGVGFSICRGTEAECEFDDLKTSVDALAALNDFLGNKYPEFQSNDLYISGESYGGIYVPWLAW